MVTWYIAVLTESLKPSMYTYSPATPVGFALRELSSLVDK